MTQTKHWSRKLNANGGQAGDTRTPLGWVGRGGLAAHLIPSVGQPATPQLPPKTARGSPSSATELHITQKNPETYIIIWNVMIFSFLATYFDIFKKKKNKTKNKEHKVSTENWILGTEFTPQVSSLEKLY